MKTWLYALAGAALLSQGATAQESTLEATLDKKIHAGLSLSTGMLFTNFETNTISTSGVGGYFGLGFGANFNFSNNIGLFTGLEFHFERFGYQPNNTAFNYDFNDKTILRQGDSDPAQGTIRLMERRQSTVAANIPLMLLFRTNMIGYFRYFGKFGLRNSILLRQRVNDNGFVDMIDMPIATEQTKLEGMRAPNDMFFFRSAGGISGGTEWNFAAKTSLSVEIGYYYGFTPVFSGNGKLGRKNSTLYTVENAERTYRSFKANQSVFEFKAILLF
jgi:hypothetical protein